MSLRRNIGAFTLLEMLVALAVMGILAVSLGASLQIAFGARRRAEAPLATVKAAALAMDLVGRDIEPALPPRGLLAGAFVGTDEKDASTGADADTLSFFTAAGDATGNDCDIRKIELTMVESEDGRSRNLARRMTANLLAPETPEPVEEILCRGVMSLNFRYFDGSDWYDAWDSTTRDNTIPAAVEVKLEIERKSDSKDADTCVVTRLISLPCSVTQSDTPAVRGLGPSL